VRARARQRKKKRISIQPAKTISTCGISLKAQRLN